jgi:hypothetical protein
MCPIKNYVDFAFNEIFYFILFSCALWIKISLKLHNGHKNEELENIYLGKICLYYEFEEWCETNNHIQYSPRHDEHLTNFLFIHNYDWKNKFKK